MAYIYLVLRFSQPNSLIGDAYLGCTKRITASSICHSFPALSWRDDPGSRSRAKALLRFVIVGCHSNAVTQLETLILDFSELGPQKSGQ